MVDWLQRAGDTNGAQALAAHAEKARASFNRRFWNPTTGYLFDVVDGENGDDPKCRPNQLFAMSLPNPVLDPARWPAVLNVVEEQLITPVGQRSLAPSDSVFLVCFVGVLCVCVVAFFLGFVW